MSSLWSSLGRALFVRLTGAALLFGVGVLFARQLGPSQFGNYALFLATVAIVSIPSTAGVTVHVVREVAKSVRDHDGSFGIGAVKYGLALTAANAIFCVPVVALLVDSWGAGLFGGVATFGLGIDATRAGWMQGMGSGVRSQVPEAVWRPLGQLLFFGALTLVTSSYEAAVGSYACGVLFAAALGVAMAAMVARRGGIRVARTLLTVSEFRSYGREAFLLGLMGALQRLQGSLDVLLLGWLGAARQVANYRVATQLTVAATLPHGSIGPVLNARLSGAFARQDYREAQVIAVRSARLMTGVTLGVGALLVLMAETLVVKVYGEAYAPASLVLLPLVLAQLANAVTGPALTLLFLSRYEVDALACLSLGLAVVIALALSVPSLAAVSMAWVMVAGSVTTNFAFALRVKRRTGINPLIVGRG